MKKVGKVLFFVLLGMIGLVGIVYTAGSFMPRGHTVTRSIELQQSPETVWKTITTFDQLPKWHDGVVAVRQLDDNKEGQQVWEETYEGNMTLQLATTEKEAPVKLVRTIVDDSGPFCGYWTYQIFPSGNGCKIAITEQGEIPNPFVRLVARLTMDPAQNIEQYLQALAKKFDEEAKIQKN